MQVYIDEQLIEGMTEISGTLEETVRKIQRDACSPGRLVVAVRCDGKELTGHEMTEALTRSASNLQKLELFTGTPGQLVAEAAEQASAMLSASEDISADAARLLTEGKSQEGISKLSECISIWQQVHEAAAKSIAMLEVDAENTYVNDTSFIAAIGRPREALLQVRGALQAQDHVLLADLLQLELKEVTDLWHALLLKIRELAQGQED